MLVWFFDPHIKMQHSGTSCTFVLCVLYLATTFVLGYYFCLVLCNLATTFFLFSFPHEGHKSTTAGAARSQHCVSLELELGRSLRARMQDCMLCCAQSRGRGHTSTSQEDSLKWNLIQDIETFLAADIDGDGVVRKRPCANAAQDTILPVC